MGLVHDSEHNCRHCWNCNTPCKTWFTHAVRTLHLSYRKLFQLYEVQFDYDGPKFTVRSLSVFTECLSSRCIAIVEVVKQVLITCGWTYSETWQCRNLALTCRILQLWSRHPMRVGWCWSWGTFELLNQLKKQCCEAVFVTGANQGCKVTKWDNIAQIDLWLACNVEESGNVNANQYLPDACTVPKTERASDYDHQKRCAVCSHLVIVQWFVRHLCEVTRTLCASPLVLDDRFILPTLSPMFPLSRRRICERASERARVPTSLHRSDSHGCFQRTVRFNAC